MLGDANVICSNFYFAALVNEMSAQPAFMYSFEYLSGWNSNRNTGAFFQEANANLKEIKKTNPDSPILLYFL
jgi:hypothetical protein